MEAIISITTKACLLYCFNWSEVTKLNLVKKSTHLDFTSLLTSSIKKNKKVGYYVIKDKDWIDVGQMDKYKNFINKEV